MNKKNLIIFFCLFFFIILSKKVYALDVIDQQNTASGANYCLYNAWSSSFTPVHNNISKIEFNPGNCSGGSCLGKRWEFYVCQGGTQYFSASTHCGTNTEIYSIASTSVSSFADLEDLKPDVAITPFEPYYFVLYSPDTTFNVAGAGGGYAVIGKDCTPPHSTEPDGAGQTLFTEYYNEDFVDFNIFWSIEIMVPDHSWLYTSMPGLILFKYNNLGGVYTQARFQLYKLDAKNGSPTLSLAQIHVNIASTTKQVMEGAEINLYPGYYRLYNAHLWSPTSSSGNLMTDVRDFQVNATSTLNSLTNASTTLSEIMSNLEENVCDNIDTGTTCGMLLCAFKKAGLWLFKPDESSITSLITSYIEFKNVFPFNSFFGITDAFQGGISTTTASVYQTFKIPFVSATGTIITLPIISSSTLGNLIGQSNNNIFRQSFIYFGWILCAMIIYFTIKRI